MLSYKFRANACRSKTSNDLPFFVFHFDCTKVLSSVST